MDEVRTLYPEYVKTGAFEYDRSLEDSGTAMARYFAHQAACMFMKMFVRL